MGLAVKRRLDSNVIKWRSHIESSSQVFSLVSAVPLCSPKKIKIGTQNSRGKKLAKAECLCSLKPGTIEGSQHRPFSPMLG